MSKATDRDSERPKRIFLIGSGRHDEGRAGGTVSPGHLIQQDVSDGRFVTHNSEGGHAETSFAMEDANEGKTIWDDYSADDLVQITRAQRGDKLFPLLKAGVSYAPGVPLISAGDGALKRLEDASSDVENAVVLAYFGEGEALDLSDSGTEDARGSVRIA